MDMNINKMVQACPWKHPQKIYLQVVYPVGRKYRSAPSAPRLKLVSTVALKSLFSVDDVKLPSWVDGMCMGEYLPNLEELLHRQICISEAVSLIDVRRCFIEALAPFFGRPLEADSVLCRKAHVLFPLDHLHSWYILTSQLNFLSNDHFWCLLQSTQHFNSIGAPVKSTVRADYPWSPRWEIPQMAERL